MPDGAPHIQNFFRFKVRIVSAQTLDHRRAAHFVEFTETPTAIKINAFVVYGAGADIVFRIFRVVIAGLTVIVGRPQIPRHFQNQGRALATLDSSFYFPNKFL